MPLNLAMLIQAGLPAANWGAIGGLLDTFEFETQVGNSLVVREPVGVVGAITPWNYPLHQITLKVAPALAAGCTVVLKPSEVAPLNAFILAEIIDDVGLPAGVFNLVTGIGPVVGEAIASHPDVDMVSFTGSTRAGKRVAELASQRVERVALELGGKSANVILDDADLATAVADGVGKAFLNSGQTCSALTRMLVPRDKLAEAEQIAVATAETVHASATRSAARPSSARSCRRRSATRVRDYIQKGIDEGATLLTGGAEAARGPRQGLLRQADGVLERHQRHDDRAGRDLRPGAVDHRLRHRGRGDRDRQRHDLRPRRRRVVRRPGPRQAGRARRSAPVRSRSTAARSTSPLRSAATSSPASAARPAPSASRSSSRSSRSSCKDTSLSCERPGRCGGPAFSRPSR